MPSTHYSSLAGKIIELTQNPKDPREGQWYVNPNSNVFHIRASSAWYGRPLTTTTSTSTSTTTTTTSTSTTTTSSSTSSSSSTSISTSSSTTTTL